jgi:hypothetical protein
MHQKSLLTAARCAARALASIAMLASCVLTACASSPKADEPERLEMQPPKEEAPLTARVLDYNRSRADSVSQCHSEVGRDGDGQAFVLLIVSPGGDVLDSYGFHPDQPTEDFQRCVGESLVGLRYGLDLAGRGIFVQPLSVSAGGVVAFELPEEGIGQLPSDVVQQMLDSGRSEWASCALPDTNGRAVVRFVIAPDGVVRMPEIAESTLSDPSVERCLANVARKLVFPRPDGGAVVVNYPIRF